MSGNGPTNPSGVPPLPGPSKGADRTPINSTGKGGAPTSQGDPGRGPRPLPRQDNVGGAGSGVGGAAKPRPNWSAPRPGGDSRIDGGKRGGGSTAGPPLRRPDDGSSERGGAGPGHESGSRRTGSGAAEKPGLKDKLGDLAKKTAREAMDQSPGGMAGAAGAHSRNRAAGMSNSESGKSVVKEQAAAAAVKGIKTVGNSLFPMAGDATVFGLRLARILAPIVGMGLLVLVVIMVAIFTGGMFSSDSSMTYALAPGAPQGVPDNYLAAYQAAGQQYNVPWTILAGIGEVATNQGMSAPSDVADYHAHVKRLYPSATGSGVSSVTTSIPASPSKGTSASSKSATGSTSAAGTSTTGAKKKKSLPTIIGNSCVGVSCVVSPPIGTGAGEPKGPLLLNADWLAKNADGMNPQSINDSAMMLASALANAETQVLQADTTGKYSNYTSDPTQADAFWAAVVAQAPITLPDQGASVVATGAGGASAGVTSIASAITVTPTGGNWVSADIAQCPMSPAGPGGPAPGAIMGTSLSLHKICADSVAAAATPQAAIAIIKALTNLGLIYTENTNPLLGPLRSDTLYSDCSSYVSRMYYEAGVNINPEGSTFSIAADTSAFNQEEAWNARPGDLVMFSNEQHVGMILADGMIAENGISGPPPLGASHVDMFGGPYWANAIYFRVNPSGAGANSGVLPFTGPGSHVSNVLIANPADWSVIQFAIYYGGDYPGDTRAGTFTAAGAASFVGTASVSSSQITALIEKYWPKNEWDNAERVAACESSDNPSAVDPDSNGTQDLGVFQINTSNLSKLLAATGYPSSDTSLAFNAGWNVQAAAVFWKSETSNSPIGSGWWPWVCASKLNIVSGLYSHNPGPGDTSGLYQSFLAQQG